MGDAWDVSGAAEKSVWLEGRLIGDKLRGEKKEQIT